MTEFRGGDPDNLDDLAATLDRRVRVIHRSATEAYTVLDQFGRSAVADRLGMSLSRIGRELGGLVTELHRRAGLIRDAELLVPGSGSPSLVAREAQARAEFALVAPLEVHNWTRAYRAWRDGPSAATLVGRGPAEVFAVLSGVSTYAEMRLLLTAPELIGGLDGAPPDLRYAANRIMLQREILRLQTLAETLALELAFFPVGATYFRTVMEREVLAAELDEVEATMARYRLWAGEDRQILRFDPTGNGRVVEVFGDLSTAEHVGIVVPGITNDITNFGPVDGRGFRAHAWDLFRASAQFDDSVATIAWLGYDTPDGADAVLRGAAEEGHDDLIRFVDGLVAAGDRHVTVIGHSYGSLVTGMAAGARIAADEIVFVGSPGTSLDRATDANLPPGGEVWSGLASWDPIGAGVSLAPSDLWEGSLSVPGRYLWDLVTSGDLAVEDLWHGTNPVHDSFGAVEFTTDGATGHSQYFDPGTESLENLARIVAGLVPRVTGASSEPVELAPGPFGRPWVDPVADVA